MKLCPKCGKRFSDDANFCPVDAARLTLLDTAAAGAAAAGTAPIDSLASRFELRERLGGDRTGTVCRAVDRQSQALVAIKVLAPEITGNAQLAQRVERELKQLERLQHSGIAKVLASGKRGEQTWVATELVDGARPLDEVVRSHGPLSSSMASELVEHIGEALIEAAQVGVVHHDLSPKNVLLAGSDLKLINFSVPVSSIEATPGVAEFVSPEQVEGKPADQRSNIYSLGTLFYFALTGRTPFQGNATEVHAQHAAAIVTPPSQLVAIAPELETVILRALERAPSKRYLTVRQFVDEVVRVSRGGGENLKTTQPLGRAGKPKADLVQTLLGMPGDQLRSAAAHLKAQEAAAAQAAASAPVTPGLTTPMGAATPVAPAPATVSATVSAAVSAAVPTPVPSAGSAPVVGPGAVPGSAAIAAQPSASVAAQPAASLSSSIVPPHVAAAPTQATPAISASAASASSASSASSTDRSPWAPPGADGPPEMPGVGVASAPAVAAPITAGSVAAASASVAATSPAASASAPAAASLAAPSVKGAAAPSGSGRRKRTESGGGGGKSKGKFRETMWFKKGELDAAAAEAAAAERARTGKEVDRDKADSLPMDERYKDDGSLSHGDQNRYSLKTGGTQMMPALRDPATSGEVSEDALINEMKAGRGKYVLAILVMLLAIGALVLLVMR